LIRIPEQQDIFDPPVDDVVHNSVRLCEVNGGFPGINEGLVSIKTERKIIAGFRFGLLDKRYLEQES
jgi:hypothetical protein